VINYILPLHGRTTDNGDEGNKEFIVC
jgi:hypothetical protein